MKKAQMAMEFLTTYGWALMISIAAVGYLSYAFLSTPGNVVPETCTFTEGVTCDDFQLVALSGVLTLSVKSAVGGAIDIDEIRCKPEDGSEVIDTTNYPVATDSATNVLCDMGASKFNAGDKIKVDVTITYVPTGLGLTLPKATQGYVIVTAQ